MMGRLLQRGSLLWSYATAASLRQLLVRQLLPTGALLPEGIRLRVEAPWWVIRRLVHGRRRAPPPPCRLGGVEAVSSGGGGRGGRYVDLLPSVDDEVGAGQAADVRQWDRQRRET